MDLTLLASLLPLIFGSLFLYYYGVSLSTKNRKTGSTERGNAATTTTVIGQGDGGLRDDGDDVIIVGAGVAGAALAHTLGKVTIFLFFLFLFFIFL